MKLDRRILLATKKINAGCGMAFHHRLIAVIVYKLKLASGNFRGYLTAL
jgi:hypothetical protein